MPEIRAIVGATILDGNGGAPLRNGRIVIEGNRIVEVGDESIRIPPDARIIPASGKYAIPGLMDANVHLFFAITPDGLIRYTDRYEEVITEAAQIALRSGVTTVFDTWGPRRALERTRDRINGGELEGSRIFLAGNIIGCGGPTSSDFLPITRTILTQAQASEIDAQWEQGVGADLLWMTANQVRARVRQYIHSGRQDFLKYAGSGHTQMQFICFSAEAQRAIVEEGHRAGLTVQAHTTSPESLRMEIEAGADLLQHGDVTGPVQMPEETLALIVERRIPCAALFATRRFLAWNKAHSPEPIRSMHQIKDENDRRLVAAGAQLLLTTDAGVLPTDAACHPVIGQFAAAEDLPIELGEGHFRWLEAAAELGMAPMAALMAATRNIAEAYKVDRDLGTLEKGKIADIVILDRDPLQSPSHYRSISLIIKEGRTVDRNSLPTLRLLTAPGANERAASSLL